MFKIINHIIKIFAIIAAFHLMYSIKAYSKNPSLFYILQWTRTDREPFVFWKPQRKSFTSMNCKYQNCYITKNKELFNDITYFDVIVFNGIDIKGNMELPKWRVDTQIYVFLSTEPAQTYPVYGYDWFFNYTWTYKLISDIWYPYITVRSKLTGEVIAPKKNVEWVKLKDMKPTPQSVIDRLQNKKTAAAWFVSNCWAHSGRLNYIGNLREALNYYNQDVDIYGDCGVYDCPREEIDVCFAKVERDYYFYLSFENSFSEDYVTEKLLTALGHFAVPVVFGRANYSRFMPDGIYLDAHSMDEEALAKKMTEIVNDRQKYYDYFRWHNYYSFHDSWESAETDPLCSFCAFLNGNWKNTRRVYARFAEWWNESGHSFPQTMQPDTIVYFNTSLKQPYISYIQEDLKSPSILESVGDFAQSLYYRFIDS